MKRSIIFGLWGMCLLAVSGCAPANPEEDGSANGDASLQDGVSADRPARGDTGVDLFDAVEFDVPDGAVAFDAPNPSGCTGWCTFRLTECGSPEAIARVQCAARCAAVMNGSGVAACLRAARCVDVSNAFARGTAICELEPVLDSGVTPDVPNPRDVPTDIPNARDVPTDIPNARDVPNPRDVPTDIPNARDVPTDIPNARDVPTDVRG